MESWLYEKLSSRRVRCHVCALRCVIGDGRYGACRTRSNRNGTLYTHLFGVTSSVCIDPIEKKPLYHFFPGSRILSMGTRGCNFRCPGCQNWEISHDRPERENMQPMEPEESARLALRQGCAGIGWTYNDPTIWIEQTHPAMIEAKKLGLYSVYITNGYATPEHLDLIGPHLTAWRVDIKGFSRATYKKISGVANFEPVLEMTKRAQFRYGMHVECVTNVTPTISDDEGELRALARWIRTELGEFTPWHVTRFHPYLELSHLPATPIRTLERAYEIGREEGLRYVYLGNVPGHRWEDTYCHRCGACVVSRRHFAVLKGSLRDGNCAACGAAIPGRWGQGAIVPAAGEQSPLLFS